MDQQDTMLIGAPLLQVFGRLGCGGLILSTQRHVLAANAEARRILQDVIGLSEDGTTGIQGQQLSGALDDRRARRRGRTLSMSAG